MRIKSTDKKIFFLFFRNVKNISKDLPTIIERNGERIMKSLNVNLFKVKVEAKTKIEINNRRKNLSYKKLFDLSKMIYNNMYPKLQYSSIDQKP